MVPLEVTHLASSLTLLRGSAGFDTWISCQLIHIYEIKCCPREGMSLRPRRSSRRPRYPILLGTTIPATRESTLDLLNQEQLAWNAVEKSGDKERPSGSGRNESV
jgi:hypothetical protein